MTTPNDGGPAFPGPDQGETKLNLHEGMSLRDWFAGQALAGFVIGELVMPEHLAGRAYAIADAMLTAKAAQREGEK